MKIVLMISFLLSSITGYSQNTAPVSDSSIVYMLPYRVDSLLMMSADSGNCFFYLTGSFKHYQIKVFKINNDISLSDWLKSTHRVVFLNQKFYPLLLETDQLFGTITDSHYAKKKRFNRKYLTAQNSLSIIDFTYDGSTIKN